MGAGPSAVVAAAGPPMGAEENTVPLMQMRRRRGTRPWQTAEPPFQSDSHCTRGIWATEKMDLSRGGPRVRSDSRQQREGQKSRRSGRCRCSWRPGPPWPGHNTTAGQPVGDTCSREITPSLGAVMDRRRQRQLAVGPPGRPFVRCGHTRGPLQDRCTRPGISGRTAPAPRPDLAGLAATTGGLLGDLSPRPGRQPREQELLLAARSAGCR